jgi:hypothetical protein
LEELLQRVGEGEINDGAGWYGGGEAALHFGAEGAGDGSAEIVGGLEGLYARKNWWP